MNFRHTNKQYRAKSDLPRNLNIWIKNLLALSKKPLSKDEILASLPSPATRDAIFYVSRELKTLLENKNIFCLNEKFELGKEEFMHVDITCILNISSAGFGYATPEKGQKIVDKIFVPTVYLKNAAQGDTVKIYKISKSIKGYEGVVHSVISRSSNPLVVVIMHKESSNKYIGLSKSSSHVQFIVESDDPLNNGDIVEIKIAAHADNYNQGQVFAHVKNYIGNIDNPSTDNAIAKLENNIPNDFPSTLRKEIDTINESRYDFMKDETRKDYRNQSIITIDPDHSKDFDDALYVEKLENGNYKLYVHIADVTHYIKSGSPIDQEAKRRCNSTYLPGEVIPMLPFELSDDMCSLIPHEDRPSFSVEMEIDKNGETVSYKLFKGIINSKHRFTYREAREVIDNKRESEFKPLLDLCCELCHVMKACNEKRGNVSIVLDEVKIILDENDQPTKSYIEEYDITHSMIECFMVKANESVARYVANVLKKSSIFRCHEKPDPKNIEIFIEKMKALGIHVSPGVHSDEINEILKKYKGTVIGNMIAVDYIHHMHQAVYSTKNKGHFGLNIEFYSHFTSPIRRYSDLLLHKLAFNKEEISVQNIEGVAKDCSEKERISSRAEKCSVKMKKLRLIKQRFQDGDIDKYKVIVNKIFKNKVSAEIEELHMPILIPLYSFKDAFYRWDAYRHILVANSGKEIRRGSVLIATIEDVDIVTETIKVTIDDKSVNAGLLSS